MGSGDWIRAYYIFQDLIAETPDDLELQDFFEMTKAGMEKTAFFQDEMHMDSGELQSGAVFSLPIPERDSSAAGRMIIRMDALSALPDFSYAMGIEIIAFDGGGALAYRLEAPYGKVIPLDIHTDGGNSGSGNGIRESVLLMHVLDRNDETIRWLPRWSRPESANGNAAGTQVMLNVSYEDFLLLSNAERGINSLSLRNLFQGIDQLSSYGYIPEVFEAEILNRFMEPMSYLPLAVLIIIIGWRFRAIKRPRYIIFPMIGMLPVVFSGLTAFSRNIVHTIGTSLILSMSFTGAFLVFFAVNFVCFIFALIMLAGQHG